MKYSVLLRVYTIHVHVCVYDITAEVIMWPECSLTLFYLMDVV